MQLYMLKLDLAIAVLQSETERKERRLFVTTQWVHISTLWRLLRASMYLRYFVNSFYGFKLLSEFVSQLIRKDLNNARLTNADIVKVLECPQNFSLFKINKLDNVFKSRFIFLLMSALSPYVALSLIKKN